MDVRVAVKPFTDRFFGSESKILLEELLKIYSEWLQDKQQDRINLKVRDKGRLFDINLNMLKELIKKHAKIDNPAVKQLWTTRLMQVLWDMASLYKELALDEQQKNMESIKLFDAFQEKYAMYSHTPSATDRVRAETELYNLVNTISEEQFNLLLLNSDYSPNTSPGPSSPRVISPSRSMRVKLPSGRSSRSSSKSPRKSELNANPKNIHPKEEQFLRQWTDFQLSCKSSIQIKANQEIIPGQLYYSTKPTQGMLEEIWKNACFSDDRKGKKYQKAVVVTIDDHINLKDLTSAVNHSGDSFNFRQIQMYHWDHLQLPYSDHINNDVLPEHLLWMTRKIKKYLDHHHLVIIHGGADGISALTSSKKERSAAIILTVLLATEYSDLILNLPSMESNAGALTEPQSGLISLKKRKSVDYFQTSMSVSTGGRSHSSSSPSTSSSLPMLPNSSGLRSLSTPSSSPFESLSLFETNISFYRIGKLLKSSIQYLHRVFKTSKFQLDLNDHLLSEEDWKNILILNEKNPELYSQCKGLVYGARAIDLFLKTPESPDDVYQGYRMGNMVEWFQTDGFKNLKFYLNWQVSQNQISVDAANHFFSYFIQDFDLACDQFLKIYMEYEHHHRGELNQFANYHSHPIGSLFLEISKDQMTSKEFKQDLFRELNLDFTNYQQSNHKSFLHPLQSAILEEKKMLHHFWEHYFDEDTRKYFVNLIQESKLFSASEQEYIQFYLDHMPSEELIFNFISSMNVYIHRVYLSHETEDDVSRQETIKMLQRDGYPFSSVLTRCLSKSHEPIVVWMQQIYFPLVCIKFGAMSNKTLQIMLNQYNTMIKVLYQFISRIQNEENKLELIRKVSDECIRALKFIAKKEATGEVRSDTVYVDLFIKLCECKFASASTSSSPDRYFDVVLRFLYWNVVDIVVNHVSPFSSVHNNRPGALKSSSYLSSSSSGSESDPLLVSTTANTKKEPHLLDIKMKKRKHQETAGLDYRPKETNHLLLSADPIVKMNKKILGYIRDRKDQLRCLKEIVNILMLHDDALNFFNHQQQREEVLTQEPFLDRVLVCAGLSPISSQLENSNQAQQGENNSFNT